MLIQLIHEQTWNLERNSLAHHRQPLTSLPMTVMQECCYEFLPDIANDVPEELPVHHTTSTLIWQILQDFLILLK